MAERAQLAAKTSAVKNSNSIIQTRKTNHFQSIRSPTERILFLQKTAGNQAVQRLLRLEMGKEKLTGGQTENKIETESTKASPAVAAGKSASAIEKERPATIKKKQAPVTPILLQKDKVEKPEPPAKTPVQEAPALEAAAATPGTAKGTTDGVMKNFTESRASEIAATYPVLGENLTQGFKADHQAAATNTPPIQVRTVGKDKLTEFVSPPSRPTPTATISKGTTEPEPQSQKAEPHRDLAPQPKNEELVKDAESPESARNVIGSIITHDPGLDTNAGERPIFETSGNANPQRAARQHEEGTTQVQQQQSAIAEQINSHPGAEQIQPVRVNEQAKITISEASETIKTSASDEMAGYTAMSIPENVRQAADAKMAPLLKQSMAGPRAKMDKAMTKRDKDKQAAIENTQEQAAELSQQAQLDQATIVRKSHQDVSQEQKRGLQESRQRMQAFTTETGERQGLTSREVNQQIESDQRKANEHLTAAEAKAEAERQKGEQQAAAKKQELEAQSKEKSWWDKAVSAIKSAVSVITKAIDVIFNAVRKLVKNIIDAARKFVVNLIEAGRKWVVGKLEAFGSWLKEKVNKYLKDFPAIVARINKAIDKTVNAATRAVNAIANKLKASVNALANALSKAIDFVLSTFQGVLKGVVALYGAVLTGDFAVAAKMVFLAACQVLGIAAEKFMGILNKAGSAITIIFKDPIGFLKNLMVAVKKGFIQFTSNIMKHLIGGLMGWLFGALEKAGIQVPTEFSLKAIFGLVMEILGVTYARIRAKAVKLIGEKNVEYIEKVWKFISMLITKGPAGLWEHIKEYLGNLKDTIIDAVKGWVVTKIIQAAVTKLLSMFNPVGAIVQAVLGIYNTVMFFIERINQIITLVEAIVNSIYKIATGAIGDAANWVENAMARTVPVIISFLARLIGLGGISEKISSIIKKVQMRVDKAIDKVIAKVAQSVVAKAKKVLGKTFGKKEKTKGTEGEKQQALKSAVAEVRKEMIIKDATVKTVEAKLPVIKAKFQLTSLILVKDKKNQYHVKAIINPTLEGPSDTLLTQEVLVELKKVAKEYAYQIKERNEVDIYKEKPHDYITKGTRVTTGKMVEAKGVVILQQVVNEHKLTMIRNPYLQWVGEKGIIGGRGPELDYLIIGTKGLQEIVSAKIAEPKKFKPKNDKDNIKHFTKIPLEPPGLIDYVKKYFGTNEKYDEIVGVNVVSSTETSTETIPLADFRSLYLKEVLLDKIYITPLTPGPEQPTGLQLSVTKKELVDEVVNLIKTELGIT